MGHKLLLIPLILLFLLGTFFLGKGITGFVVSQSCCFPPSCAPEDRCPYPNPTVESNLAYISSGGAIAVISFILYALLNRKSGIKSSS